MDKKMEFANGSGQPAGSNRKERGLQIAKWLLTIPLLSSSLAWAAPVTWNGSSDNVWSDGANWDTGLAPTSVDTAIFSGNPASGNLTPTNGVVSSVLGLDFSGATASFNVINNNSLTVGNDGILSVGTTLVQQLTNNASLTLQGGIIDSNLQLTNTGTVSVEDGVTGFDAHVVNNNSITFTRSASPLTMNGTLSGSGTLTKEGVDSLILNSDVTQNQFIVNAGSLQVGSGGNSGSISGDVTVAAGSNITFDRSGSLTYTDVIDGEGGVIKQGSGTLILSGNNTYTGDTTVNAGTLQVTGDVLTSPITNDGMVIFNSDVDQTYYYNIGGSGQFIKDGSGMLTLHGVIDNAGGIAINEGTLRLGENTQTGWTANLPIENHGHLIFNRSDNFVYAGVISGDGDLTQDGSGRLLLNAANTYTGDTFVNQGVLQFNIDAIPPAGDIVNHSHVIFATDSNDLTYAGDMSGSGDMSKFGGSQNKLTLTGNNTYTGKTYVTAFNGYLYVGDGNTHGSLTSDIELGQNTRVYFDRSDHLVYPGVISSPINGQALITGGLMGTGVVTFTGNSTSSGKTFVQGGTLELGDGGATGMVNSDIETAENSYLVFNHNVDVVFDHLIEGAGSVTKKGINSLTLTADNTYSGTTTVEGGVLNIGQGGNTGEVNGPIINQGQVIFNRSGNAVYRDVISGSGSVTKLGTGRLFFGAPQLYTGVTTISEGTLTLGDTANLSGDVVNNAVLEFRKYSDDIHYNGQISGSGEVVFLGAIPTTTLTGDNTYTGLTTNVSHNLQLGDPDVNNATTGSVVGDIFNQRQLIIFRNNNYTYAGKIYGDGWMTKRGSGTLTLLGNNTLLGALYIEKGAVQLGDGGTQGFYESPIVNDATLILNRSDDVSYAQTISGEGRFIKKGSGMFTLLGQINNSGGVEIEAGTLKVGDGDAFGNVNTTIDNHSVLIMGGNYNLNFPYAIRGSGDFIKQGSGELMLSEDTSYTGTTRVEAGTLHLFGANASPAFVLNQGAELRLDSSGIHSYAADISGEGSLRITNWGGRVILTGHNTYSGGTFVQGGLLQIGDGGDNARISGDIVANSHVYFNNGDDWTYNGSIRHNYYPWASVYKQGHGTLTLNGTYDGSAHITEGTLLIGGSADHSDALFNDAAVVYSGATLGGHGTVGRTLTNRGTVSPGASIGTLTVQGDYVQDPSATLMIEVDSDGNSDLLQVGGNASIAGNLMIDTSAGFLPGHDYTILTAGGDLAGSFANVDGIGRFDQDFLTGRVNFDDENGRIFLTAALNPVAIGEINLNHNERIIADYLIATGGGDAASQGLLGAAKTAAQLELSANQLSGATYANQELQLAQTSRWFESQIANRMVLYPDCQREENKATNNNPVCAPHKAAWVTVSGSQAEIAKEDNGTSGLDTSMGGVAAGIEFPVKHGGKIGAALSAIYFSGDATGVENASDDGGLYQFGVYTHFHHGNWDLGANVDVGGTDSLDTTRTVGDYSNTSSYGASVIAQQVRIGYDIAAKYGVHVRPFVGFLNQQVSRDSFTESGSGTTLSVDEADFHSAKSVLGSAVEIPLGKLTFLASLDWLHEFDDTHASISGSLSQASDTTQSFSDIKGISIGRDSTRVQAGLKFADTGKVQFTALYVGDFAGSYSENGATLQVDFDLS